MKHTGVVLLFISLILSSVPAPALAVSLQSAPVAEYANHNDDTDEEDEDDEDSYRSYSRERYSSSVRRKINKLDEDIVEKMPVPVLFVQYSKIYSDFGDPRDGGAREHEGQDIIAPRGTPIISPTEAVVTRTGKGGSAGIYVYTANPGGESFRYMHLEKIAEGIKEGTELKVGDLIGYVGDTGNALGGVTHLHFEIRDGREALDPYPRITGTLTRAELIRAITDIIEALKKELEDAD